MKYAVLIEKVENNFSAYSPNVPGCGATGETEEDALRMIKETIEYHLEGLREDGLPVPQPSSLCQYVEITDAA